MVDLSKDHQVRQARMAWVEIQDILGNMVSLEQQVQRARRVSQVRKVMQVMTVPKALTASVGPQENKENQGTEEERVKEDRQVCLAPQVNRGFEARKALLDHQGLMPPMKKASRRQRLCRNSL